MKKNKMKHQKWNAEEFQDELEMILKRSERITTRWSWKENYIFRQETEKKNKIKEDCSCIFSFGKFALREEQEEKEEEARIEHSLKSTSIGRNEWICSRNSIVYFEYDYVGCSIYSFCWNIRNGALIIHWIWMDDVDEPEIHFQKIQYAYDMNDVQLFQFIRIIQRLCAMNIQLLMWFWSI